MLRRLILFLAALAFFAGASPSHAQVFIVATCGTVPTSQATLTAGNAGMYFIDTSGKLCVNATVSATATIAAFAPVGTNNALAVTSTTARTALTGAAANSTTLVENSGATDVFVAFGDNTVTVTAANGTRVPAGWGIAFNIGANTNIAYITASSTSTINATTGTGLPALGAAGSGGGGAITSPLGAGTSAGAVRVTSASDDPVIAAINAGVATPGSAPPTNVLAWGALGSGATGGLSRAVINCDQHVFKHITSATDTLAVQGVASQTVFICGWKSRAAGTATWFLENTASVNANCSSSNTQITGLSSEIANSGEVLYNPIWGGLKNTAGNGLCINSTGTGGVDVDIWYAQF